MSGEEPAAPGTPLAESAGGELVGVQTGKWMRWIATSLIALARNLGAGIGISSFAAFVARREQFHQARLAASVAANHSLSSVRSGLRGYLMQQGESSAHAAHQAVALIYHQLLEQAATLSYMDGFRVIAILLFITVPSVGIMKKPQFKSLEEVAE